MCAMPRPAGRVGRIVRTIRMNLGMEDKPLGSQNKQPNVETDRTNKVRQRRGEEIQTGDLPF
jgi:hypothetical protein